MEINPKKHQESALKRNSLAISERATTPETSSHSSLILQKGATYSGPHAVDLFPSIPKEYSRFNSFGCDPLYNFPILNSVAFTGRLPENKAVLATQEFTHINTWDLTQTLQQYSATSPFKQDNSELIGDVPVPLNSEISEGSQYISMHCSSFEFSSEAKGEKHSSVNLELSESNIPKSNVCSISSMSSGSILYQPDSCPSDFSEFDFEPKPKLGWNPVEKISEDFSELSSSEEAEISIHEDGPSNIAELLPERSYDSSNNFFQSMEALTQAQKTGQKLLSSSEESFSSAEEGTLQLPNRLVLGDGASKHVLEGNPNIQEVPKKTNKETESLQISSFSMIAGVDLPDVNSPLYRKLVLCRENSEESSNNVELVSSFAVSGFCSTPELEFSNLEGKSKGFVNYSASKSTSLGKLFSLRVAEALMKQKVAWVSCGFEHCCLVTVDGNCMSWGYGAAGCLGQGNTYSYTLPTAIPALKKHSVVYVECGAYHSAAITGDSELYTWGRGDVHQIGIPFKYLAKDSQGFLSLRPRKVEYFSKWRRKVRGVACGEAHTLVLDSEGCVYAFGWAEDGQLGLPSNKLKNNMMTGSVHQIQILSRQKIIKVAAGALFSAALNDMGQIYTWGNGEQGQLGNGSGSKFSDFPLLVEGLSKEFVIDLTCGESSLICLTQTGNIYGWGQGVAGVFEEMEDKYPYGSELVCYVPRCLKELDIPHRFLIRKQSYLPKPSFVGSLLNRLNELPQQRSDHMCNCTDP